MSIVDKFYKYGVVPAVKVENADDALPVAAALAAGGIPVVEITFRTAAAEEAIRRIAAGAPEILLGAGTVLTVEQVNRAVAAGAKYIVSPGLDMPVIHRALELGALPVPGCITPTDLTMAYNLSLTLVKLFPIETAGGLKLIDALSGPFGSMKYMPTGGVNATNLNAYLRHPKVIACGGSWMVKEDLIKSGDWAGITELARQASDLVPAGR